MVGKYLTRKSQAVSQKANNGLTVVKKLGIGYVSYRVSKFVIGTPIGLIAGAATASPVVYAVTKNIVGYTFGVIIGIVAFKMA